MFFKDLTKEEKEHLRKDAKCFTLEAFKRTAEAQRQMRSVPDSIEPCWTCKRIAKKLGLPI